jgi:hypothetical protein
MNPSKGFTDMLRPALLNWARLAVIIIVCVLPAPVLGSDYQSLPHSGDGPIGPPAANDTTFVLDESDALNPGLDEHTGSYCNPCVGPRPVLVLKLPITRKIGDKTKLLDSELARANAQLTIMAVDFMGYDCYGLDW